jgi:hypothetical protein
LLCIYPFTDDRKFREVNLPENVAENKNGRIHNKTQQIGTGYLQPAGFQYGVLMKSANRNNLEPFQTHNFAYL